MSSCKNGSYVHPFHLVFCYHDSMHILLILFLATDDWRLATFAALSRKRTPSARSKIAKTLRFPAISASLRQIFRPFPLHFSVSSVPLWFNKHLAATIERKSCRRLPPPLPPPRLPGIRPVSIPFQRRLPAGGCTWRGARTA